MATNATPLSCEIELQPGEQLRLPQTLVDRVGPGQWVITVQPAGELAANVSPRGHSAFLTSYAAEDEGLYDDYPAR